jgi:hypothetical protein
LELVYWHYSRFITVILERGHEEDWFASGMIVAFTVAAVLGFILFLWRELTLNIRLLN